MFIVFEGLDGSGKTTQMELLRDYLLSTGERVHLTAEPTEWRAGKIIRDVLEHRETAHPQTVAALFAADRIEHLHRPETGILARLAAGEVVIASRYYFSSLAYQSEYSNIEWIAALNDQAKQTRPADITFFLDLAPEISLERIQQNRDQIDLFENKEKLTKVRADFKKAFTFWGDSQENIYFIDASQNRAAIQTEIRRIVDHFPR
ncbi:MAG: dTMP kinase [Bacteroidota bacterium]